MAAAPTADADFVVVVAGLTPQDEGEEYTGAGDRTSARPLDAEAGSTPRAHGVQNDLIAAVAAMGKPMVVVLEAAASSTCPGSRSVPAVVMAWYSGQRGGAALGKLLFGQANFGGKLPLRLAARDRPAAVHQRHRHHA